MALINRALAGWPYTRPIDQALVDHWRSRPEDWQPDAMLLAIRNGCPVAFVHGDRQDPEWHIHLLAVLPGAAADAAALLAELERRARAAGATGLRGPSYRAQRFYGGYVLGQEPYVPHWARDTTEAFVRAGFALTLPAVILVRPMATALAVAAPPAGYEIVPADHRPEFDARSAGFEARHQQRPVAHCYARLYPHLAAPTGGPVAQLGHVGTDEAHRGRGLAVVLSQMALRQLRAWGASECLVATDLNNASALRTYEKLGFARRYHISEWAKPLPPLTTGAASQSSRA